MFWKLSMDKYSTKYFYLPHQDWEWRADHDHLVHRELRRTLGPLSRPELRQPVRGRRRRRRRRLVARLRRRRKVDENEPKKENSRAGIKPRKELKPWQLQPLENDGQILICPNSILWKFINVLIHSVDIYQIFKACSSFIFFQIAQFRHTTWSQGSRDIVL